MSITCDILSINFFTFRKSFHSILYFIILLFYILVFYYFIFYYFIIILFYILLFYIINIETVMILTIVIKITFYLLPTTRINAIEYTENVTN